MDLFEHRYYRLTKNCMKLIGQWPCQSARVSRVILAFIIFFFVTGVAPIILALVKYGDDWSIVVDCFIACVFAIVSFGKLIGIVWNSQKTLKLLNGTFTNWQVWARSREVNILHEYAEQGAKMTIAYAVLIYSTTILYTTQPIIQKIIDVMLKNSTAHGKFPYPVEYYYFDSQKHYCYVMMHFYISGCVSVTLVVANQNMLIMYAQHVCGVFAALGHKLNRINNKDTSVQNVVQLSSLIDQHNDAIEYAKLIEATYIWNLFFTIGLGVILLLLLGIEIFTRTNEPESTVRFVTFVVTIEFEMFIDCYISQNLMNHSINVDFYIYNSQWYRLLPKDQKLLQLMTIRCRVPSQLTAGSMLILSMRNFLQFNRTAMSYFAVIRPT